MKQYRITTDNINKGTDEDCVLDANDPANEIKRMQYLGGFVYTLNPNDYPVYPENDGTDAKRNPYSPV